MIGRLQGLVLLAGWLVVVPALEAQAETGIALAEIEPVSAQAADLHLAQAPTQITDVQIESDDQGLRLVLDATGSIGEPVAEVVGNALVVEIPNTVLALPDGESFEAVSPAEGIAFISLTNVGDDRVQISITGSDAPPTAEVNTEGTGLVIGVVPGEAIAEAAAEEALQIAVTGEQEDDYVVDDATTATRTETPLLEIPRSIQVVPREVFEDQAGNRLDDATRNVSSVVQDGGFAGTIDQLNIRGFFVSGFFRDGFRDPSESILETSNVERFEVLKGPASVLYGNIEPGGVINLVTEQPLPYPNYEFDLQAGSYFFVRPTLDLSGPLTESADLRYRLNLAFEHSDGFRDLDQDVRRVFAAPVLAWDIGDDTTLNLELSYLYDERPFDRGLLAIGRGVVDTPISRFFGEPDDFRETEEISAGYRLEHDFSDSWSIRNAFRVVSSDTIDYRAEPLSLDENTGILTRNFRSNDDISESYALQTEVEGQFSTGSIEHTLLLGFDLSRLTFGGTQNRLPAGLTPAINIFNPVYDQIPRPGLDELTVVVRDSATRTDNLGIFVQDQMDLTDNLILLLGGRLDFVEQRNDNNLGADSSQSPSAFSPSVGLLYRPIEPLAIYANYARSFQPNFGTAVDGSFLEPERGTQYEVGLRGELFDGNLIANLAAYSITKNNLATTDPNNPSFTLPIAEQRSRGIELDVAGEILPGWNVIASYGYIDSEYTQEYFGLPAGSRVQNVPEHTASLWSTYEIQEGDLQGLGFGAGVFHVGERVGDFSNTFNLPGYWRTDATVYYDRDNWRAAINVQNLFDVRYFKANNFGRVAIEPGAPLTIIGSLSINF